MSLSNPQFASEQTLNLGIDVSGVAHPDEPGKRRPGRPKGSTKKNLLGSPPPPKPKRPVGRPRKDGLPAGSVGPSRPKRESQPAPAVYQTQAPEGFQGVAYPPAAVMGLYQQPHAVYPPPPIIQIDPSLTGEEWATMSRNDPNLFMSTLLQALAAPNPISVGGPSVEDAFKLHLQALAPSQNQVQHLPSLYSILKTFWLPSSPAYFSLTSSAPNSRTPCEHRFLYWDPLPLVFNGIACPACSQPLTNKGRITSGPVKIYDIEKPFFIIGCEYLCKNVQCAPASSPDGRRFASTDSAILRSLPAKLKDEFPAKLLNNGDTDAGCGPNIWNWRALGVSISLWKMVLGALRLGLKREVILNLIHTIQNGVPPDLPPRRDPDASSSCQEQLQRVPEVPPTLPNHTDENEMQGQQSTEPPPPPQNYPEVYSEPYQQPAAKSPPPVPSTSQTPSQPPAPVSSPSAPFGFAQPPPYPFAGYGFMPAPGLMPPPPLPLVPGPPVQQKEASTRAASASTTKRSPRHCCKCGSQDCKGKGGRNFCVNACQDCGKLDCKGRNSRRPDKKCTEGWS